MDFCILLKKMGKNLSNKYGQKLLDSAKNSTMDTIKTASKIAIQKTAEETGDLVGNKIADKMHQKNIRCTCKMMMLIVK